MSSTLECVGAPTVDTEDSFDHYICNRHPDGQTFCGLDASVMTWGDDGEDCVVCAVLEENGFCPYYGTCVDVVGCSA